MSSTVLSHHHMLHVTLQVLGTGVIVLQQPGMGTMPYDNQMKSNVNLTTKKSNKFDGKASCISLIERHESTNSHHQKQISTKWLYLQWSSSVYFFFTHHCFALFPPWRLPYASNGQDLGGTKRPSGVVEFRVCSQQSLLRVICRWLKLQFYKQSWKKQKTCWKFQFFRFSKKKCNVIWKDME